jgi:esterase/lipase superfamily enzyme
MPDAGPAGWYSDWYNGGAGGAPAWETFHLKELLGLLRDRYSADGGRMVVAGLSMGGFGTMSYAARHPDLFAAAASFSGALDTCQNDPIAQPAVEAISRSQGNPPNAVWGDPIAQEVRWRAHNPVDLAPNLRGISMFVSTGNGTPGPFDNVDSLSAAPLEAGVNQQTMSFASRLDGLGIPFTRDFYGGGTHTWPYWQRELHRAMPMLTTALARARTAPRSFTYRSGDRTFSVWGWSFRASGTDPAFTDVSIDGDTIALTGMGLVHVTTPARYRPHAGYRVSNRTLTADSKGRLSFTIDAGTTAERYGPGPDSPGPRPTGSPVKVRIRRA